MIDQNDFAEKCRRNLAAGMKIENERLSGRSYVLALVISELDEDGWTYWVKLLDAFDAVGDAEMLMTKTKEIAYRSDLRALPGWFSEGKNKGWYEIAQSDCALPIVCDSSFKIGDGTHYNSRSQWFSVLDIRGIANPSEAIAAHFDKRWAVEKYFAQLVEDVIESESRFTSKFL